MTGYMSRSSKKIDSSRLTPIAFKADEKTRQALIKLQQAAMNEIEPGEITSVGSKSTIIRKAIQQAAARLT